LIVPAPTPVTTPVVVLIVAIAVLPPLHVPPVAAADRVVVEPGHTVNDPEIVPEVADIVAVIVLVQPDDMV
jgi:hypothetical protein